jgi:hypothetical protein
MPTAIRVFVSKYYFTFFCGAASNHATHYVDYALSRLPGAKNFSTFSHHLYYFKKNITDHKIYILNRSAKLSLNVLFLK